MKKNFNYFGIFLKINFKKRFFNPQPNIFSTSIFWFLCKWDKIFKNKWDWK